VNVSRGQVITFQTPSGKVCPQETAWRGQYCEMLDRWELQTVK
jgi:hypothetical protein